MNYENRHDIAKEQQLTICKITDASNYLSRILRDEVDAEFYKEVSKNGDGIYGICAEGEMVGLAYFPGFSDGFLYVYIFPEYRHRGYGYLAVCALEKYAQSLGYQMFATAYDKKNKVAVKLAGKCGFAPRFSTSIMKYKGEAFELPALPIRNHRDEDFIEAYTMSAEAFHKMRVETGHDPDSVPYVPGEEERRHAMETADQRYVYVLDDEIVGCACLDGAEIDNVSIKITHQGKGLGRMLVKYLVNRILEQKIGEPFLYCLTVNTKARRLYDSLGFQEMVCNEYAEKTMILENKM